MVGGDHKAETDFSQPPNHPENPEQEERRSAEETEEEWIWKY